MLAIHAEQELCGALGLYDGLALRDVIDHDVQEHDVLELHDGHELKV